MTFEKEVAEKVILPKLQKIYNISQGMNAGADENSSRPIKNKADFRKRFMEHEGVTISAAKFDEYLTELNITFKKVVVIGGLWDIPVECGTPPPARPSGRAVDGEEVTGEEVSFDNEDDNDFPKSHRSNRNIDMFKQI